MAENVLMVWDIYDGVRSGVALFGGEPHYFDCEFDSKAGEFTNTYCLWPMTGNLVALANEQWTIYRSWERRFHSGEERSDTHPGHRGQNVRYDEIEDQIDQYIDSLGPPTHRIMGEFQAKENQPDLPSGYLREMEVTWCQIA